MNHNKNEIMEDSIIVKRIQGEPERRVFYIDTGDMSAEKTIEYIEKVKKELQEKT